MFLLNAIFLFQAPFSTPNVGTQRWFEQKLDHFSDNTEMFNQKYFVNTSYAKKSTHLVVYIGGESKLSESVIRYDAMKIAEETKSVVLALEHRFFGDSVPRNSLDLENLKYLTVDQAIEDLAYFIESKKEEFCIKPKYCKAFMIGGSYPGSLSSWFRQKHPDIALASWASSGPIYSTVNFSMYDAHEAQDYREYTPTCYKNALSAYKTIEKVAKLQNEQTDKMLAKFGIGADKNFTKKTVDFISMVSDSYSYGNQYSANNKHIIYMCNALDKIDLSDDDAVIEIMSNTTNKLVGTGNLINFWPYLLTDTRPGVSTSDSRSWAWMSCNELGWFSCASGELRSELVTLDYYEDVCKNLFNIGFPDTDKFNAKYGGYEPDVTKVFYTHSHFDPWSELTMKNEKPKSQIYVANVTDGFHCDDLHDPKPEDSESLKSVRDMVIKQSIEWIKNTKHELLPLWGWIPIGVGCGLILIIIAIVLAVVCCKKAKHQKALDTQPLVSELVFSTNPAAFMH